jgi:hypothetical protein
MLDQTTPPFRTGDTAYTRASPGGYASAGAVPVDPAYGGTDNAYICPSLGGEFQPGSGMAAPTSSPITKGADADGGAADIAAIPRIDAPPAPVPPTIPALAAQVVGTDITFTGKATAAGTVTVTFEINNDGVGRNVITNIAAGDSAGTVAAKVAQRLNESVWASASTTSNQVHIKGKGINVLGDDPVTCVIA